MLLFLAEFLQQYYSGFSVFQYLTLRGILGVLTALAIALPTDRFERTGVAELERALREGIRQLPPDGGEAAPDL